MVKLFNQISLSDTFEECKDIYQNDKLKKHSVTSKNVLTFAECRFHPNYL